MRGAAPAALGCNLSAAGVLNYENMTYSRGLFPQPTKASCPKCGGKYSGKKYYKGIAKGISHRPHCKYYVAPKQPRRIGYTQESISANK